MLGRWVSDLEVGDILPVVDYEATPFLGRDYAHAVESTWEPFHSAVGGNPQLAPPTLAHVDKLRVLTAACPGGAGPVARMQLEYEATHHGPIAVGSRMSVSGRVESRQAQAGRERLVIVFEVRDATTGSLRTRYRDTSLLNFVPEDRR